MAQKNRSKELWLIPKRVNLHQTVCLIDGIIERNYNSSTWNAQKQNNLGVNLKKWGATRDGKNISPQGIRTLTASIPQYLGFLYINTNTTPNTICLTEVGFKLWNEHKSDLVKVKNLIEGKDNLIKESSIVLEQLEKLQITNPIILKDCENILVFPFRMTLKLLQDLEYLDREELAYIVFKIKDETEFLLAKQEILNFRKLSFSDREALINTFKETHIGNITLVKAPSAAYYESLCEITGIIEKIKVKYPNEGANNKKINAICIKGGCRNYVSEIINKKYCESKIFDFKDNLDLWIEYIGNPDRLNPPREVIISNKSSVDTLVCIKKDSRIISGDLIEKDSNLLVPMFLNEEYEIECLNINDGSTISSYKFIPLNNVCYFDIILDSSNVIDDFSELDKNDEKNKLISQILEHSNAKMFSEKILNYLKLLTRIDGKVREDSKNLRGAYYEFLFFKLLTLLMNKGIIDDVIWNGKVGKFGLPVPAPGGKTGTPDLIFRIGEYEFVLELTAIRPKTMQFDKEGSSVPDHIRLQYNKSDLKVYGIFCAPQIHERNTSIMKASLMEESITLKCVTDKELLEILSNEDREQIISKLITE
ncbi:MAG: hypothetical protein SPH93_13205 [Clostridium sp.]|uniref:hypothetical protein n=1 Tax=Clostridium sp. TaxID=1506 RepID=UPI002A916CFD|nr:hypothetical protein [Clostridium sp.]MDY6228593.1 hypothetical protein [Clostridium sp.]